jgi:hypothetical protein
MASYHMPQMYHPIFLFFYKNKVLFNRKKNVHADSSVMLVVAGNAASKMQCSCKMNQR